MKKNYFMLAATAALFAACAETDLVNEIAVEETPQAISFESFANKATRAEIDNVTALQSAGFQVWGYKYPTSANNIVWENEIDQTTQATTIERNFFTVFDGVDVTHSNGDWGYTNTQYWDKTSKYNFYAVAPKDPGTDADYSINQGLITITGVKSGLSADENFVEYLIDRDGVINREGTNKNPVSFNFSHIMSKISFKLQAGVNEQIVVTSLKMYDWDNGTATFTQGSTPEWFFTTNLTVIKENAVDIITSDITLPYDEEAEVQEATPTSVGNSYIMVPQTISYTAADNTQNPAVLESGGLKFIISYKIIRGVPDTSDNRPNDDIDDEIFTNQEGTLQMEQTWGTNTHTTYTIIVGPDAIEFGTPSIESWTTETGSGNLPL